MLKAMIMAILGKHNGGQVKKGQTAWDSRDCGGEHGSDEKQN